LNCNTESNKRYLLLTDAREDSVPEPPARKGGVKKVSQPEATSQPDNHITVTMYDWRCIQYCENLPRSSNEEKPIS
jgi:hypothetical protein